MFLWLPTELETVRSYHISAPFDCLSFGDPKLIFSSYDDDDDSEPFKILDPHGNQVSFPLSKGVTVSGDLKLSDCFGLKRLSTLLAQAGLPITDALPMAVPFGEAVEDTEIEAFLKNEVLKIPPPPLDTLILFERFQLFLHPATPVSFGLKSEVVVTMWTNILPKFLTASFSYIAPSDISISIKTDKDWDKPLGVKGLTIKKGAAFGIVFNEEGMDVGIKADIDFRQLELINMSCAFHLVPPPVFPEAFVGHLPPLDNPALSNIIKNLIGVDIPTSLPDVLISQMGRSTLVPNPDGVDIAGTRYKEGFHLSGLLTFLGLKLEADLAIDQSGGIQCTAFFPNPIKIGSMLVITGQTVTDLDRS